MTDSIINIGELSKPATVLIEKVSDAVGGIFRPMQIKRVAKAEGEAEKIRAISHLAITELRQRTLSRLVNEEVDRQKNIESVTKKAIPSLNHDANPNNIEKDWLVDFFDKARMISDSEMQEMWSKILAGEANFPGSFSKRTISLMSSLDKKDAMLFNALANFVWKLKEESFPIIFDINDEIYRKNGVNFGKLKHLDSIGLINFEALGGYTFKISEKNLKVSYMGRISDITFSKDETVLNIGAVIFTTVGQELFRICNPKSIDGFFDYVTKKLTSENLIVNMVNDPESK